MAISGIGIGFYINVGGDATDKRSSGNQSGSKPIAINGSTHIPRPDYSYGVSPTKSDGTTSGRSSPSGHYCVSPPSPAEPVQDEASLTPQERADRALAVRIWGAPWRPLHGQLLAAWRKETGRA